MEKIKGIFGWVLLGLMCAVLVYGIVDSSIYFGYSVTQNGYTSKTMYNYNYAKDGKTIVTELATWNTNTKVDEALTGDAKTDREKAVEIYKIQNVYGAKEEAISANENLKRTIKAEKLSIKRWEKTLEYYNQATAKYKASAEYAALSDNLKTAYEVTRANQVATYKNNIAQDNADIVTAKNTLSQYQTSAFRSSATRILSYLSPMAVMAIAYVLLTRKQ